MVNEHDVLQAVVAACEADTGPGGIVEMVGNSQPAVRWRHEGMKRRPVIAVYVRAGRQGSGTGRTMVGILRLSIFVGPGVKGLESRIADRLEGDATADPPQLGVVSTPALAAGGVDGFVANPRRIPLDDLAEENGRRLDLEFDLKYTRA